MPGTRRQGGQRRQWVDDINDWAGLNLPEVVTLANERRQYRQLVHKIVKSPHGGMTHEWVGWGGVESKHSGLDWVEFQKNGPVSKSALATDAASK